LGCAGLVADVLADHVVIISSSLWTEHYRDTICDLIRSTVRAHKLVWRSDKQMLLAEQGVGLRENQSSEAKIQTPTTAEALSRSSPLQGDGEPVMEREVIILEEGVKYAADPYGQKSGFYADQRENRAFLRHCIKGKKVLDLCCYSGGFALNAAMHGAEEVIGVDSAPAVIALAKRNAVLNGVADKYACFSALYSPFLACFKVRPEDCCLGEMHRLGMPATCSENLLCLCQH
jgi:2-polyprenyl-3-methyl-5-hydroxy-6-metoxy-1,4-benzoquinol methylase